MYSVGSGMVLAIGDLAGATFVTLLAATATQFARAGRLWTLCTIEIELRAAVLVGNGPRHRRPSVAAVLWGVRAACRGDWGTRGDCGSTACAREARPRRV